MVKDLGTEWNGNSSFERVGVVVAVVKRIVLVQENGEVLMMLRTIWKERGGFGYCLFKDQDQLALGNVKCGAGGFLASRALFFSPIACGEYLPQWAEPEFLTFGTPPVFCCSGVLETS